MYDAVFLRGLRADRRESLQHVADACKITKGYLWELEQGNRHRPSAEIMSRLAIHYEVPLEALLTGSGSTGGRETVMYRKFRRLTLENQRVALLLINALEASQ